MNSTSKTPHAEGHEYKFLWRFLGLMGFFCLLTLNMYAQKITVKGTVSVSDGPIIGATVKVEGTTTGVITDIDGNYSIDVQPNATLVFSYIGYSTKQVKVAGKTRINVVLAEDETVLNEMVVVGYGVMKRSDLTGSVVSVSDDAIKKSTPTSIDQVLQGRAAGVQIQSNTGTPGGSSTIRIRGTNSINLSSQPIFVIDGVVIDSDGGDDGNSNPLAAINPSDIVSMDVLKDASATAIYGARASNGVIMVTTKRGQSGKATITYDGYVGSQSLPKHLEVMNLQQYAQHCNEVADAHIKSAVNSFVRPDLLGAGTDWQDELFRTALITNHNLSITGGSQEVTYAISGGYLTQDGIALASGFERLSLRSNVDANMNKWLRGGLNFSLTDSRQEMGTENGSIMNALTSQPSTAVRNADGNFDGPDDEWMPDNPVALALIKDNYNQKLNFRVNTYLEATLLKGLTFKTELSADYNLNRYYYYEPDYKFGVKTNYTRTGKWTKNFSKYWSWRNILSYNNTFNEVHNVNLMLGQEMSHSLWETQATSATGYLSNSAKDPSAVDASKTSGTGSQTPSALFSYFGRAFYSYADRYLLTFTMRRDGSSKFSEQNRWGWFPSAAFAWKASNEKFMTPISGTVNNLKVRLGWGTTGNQNVENWTYMALLAAKSTPWGTGVINANTPNPNLKWETTYSTNVGLDVSLFRNRIEFIFDWYNKKTKDLLLLTPLPAFLGSSGQGAASNPWNNVGSIRNRGIEMTLNTVNIDKKGFLWRSSFVFSLNRNKVIEMDSEQSNLMQSLQIGSDNTNVTKTQVGHPIGEFWGYKVIGMFNEPADFYYKDVDGNIRQVALDLESNETISESGVWLGDYRFADLNGDGYITNDDQTVIGNPEPKFTWGVGNTFSWKGLDLTVQFSGSYGNDIVNYNRRWLEITGSTSNLLTSALNHAVVEKIDAEGPEDYRNYHVVNPGNGLLPRLYSDSDKHLNWRMSDAYVEDGSFIRLQNISLAYTFPKTWVKRISLENAKVYCNIQNVYTWTKYKGYDPEVGSLYGNTLLGGIDYGRYPSPRIYTIGLNVSF